MTNRFNKYWKQFILNEGTGPDISVWLQSLNDNLNLLKPRSLRETKRVELMKHQLSEVRRAINRLNSEIVRLEEKTHVLPESRNEKKSKKAG